MTDINSFLFAEIFKHTAMNSNIALALFSKLKHIYESAEKPDTFLAFTIGQPIGITLDKFKVIAEHKDDTGEEVRIFNTVLYELAAQMNQVLECTSLFTANGKDLGQVVKKIINVGSFASSPSVLLNTEKLKQLNSILYDDQMNPTPAYASYLDYQEIYYAARNRYRNNEQDISSKSSLDKAMVDWMMKGNKMLINNTMDEIISLGNHVTPLQYKTDISTLLDLSIIHEPMDFYPLIVSPINFYEGTENWIKMTFNSEAEIDSFCKQAPDELKGLTSSTNDAAGRRILSLSAEIARVDINRPWFDHEIFNKRFWKFSDNLSYSDGSPKPAGAVPAYIKGFIVCRNLDIVYEDAGSGNKSTEKGVLFNKVILGTFNAGLINEPQVFHIATLDGFVVKEQPTIVRFINDPGISLITVQDQKISPATVNDPGSRAAIRSDGLSRRRRFMNSSLDVSKKRLPAYMIEKPMSNITGTTTDNQNKQFEIVAVVCKKLGKCPDPDLTLPWE
jgi:hypothetical protein